jgi:hypothetical protein
MATTGRRMKKEYITACDKQQPRTVEYRIESKRKKIMNYALE